jgi:hypothetical protein
MAQTLTLSSIVIPAKAGIQSVYIREKSNTNSRTLYRASKTAGFRLARFGIRDLWSLTTLTLVLRPIDPGSRAFPGRIFSKFGESGVREFGFCRALTFFLTGMRPHGNDIKRTEIHRNQVMSHIFVIPNAKRRDINRKTGRRFFACTQNDNFRKNGHEQP